LPAEFYICHLYIVARLQEFFMSCYNDVYFFSVSGYSYVNVFGMCGSTMFNVFASCFLVFNLC